MNIAHCASDETQLPLPQIKTHLNFVTMYKKKSCTTPMFAEVKVAGDADRHPSSASDIQRRENRIPYIKLTYPNGVTLILPASLDNTDTERSICEMVMNKQSQRRFTQASS